MTTVYGSKLTGDLWLRHKCTKSPGICQRLSNWTCMFQLIRALYLDSDWYLGKWYMKQQANRTCSLMLASPDQISWAKTQNINPTSVQWTPFNEVLLFLLKVTGISEDQLLVTVLPGLPTTAEVFIVPEKRSRHGGVDEKLAHLDQVHFNVPWQMLGTTWFSVIIKTAQKQAEGSQESVSQEDVPGEYVLCFRVSDSTTESL